MRWIAFLLTMTTLGFCEPIDVLIPAIEKDLESLENAIDSVKLYGKDVRRVIVISHKRLTDKAEWFDEGKFPFSKESIAKTMGVEKNFPRLGWYAQQLLKLYAPQVIDGLSEKYVTLDADTVFLNRVEFVDEKGRSLFNVGDENVMPYHEHAKRFWPDYKKVYPEYSGISNYMIFDTKILNALFAEVEALHNAPFSESFIAKVDPDQYRLSGASEFEIYFNYALIRHPDKVKIEPLKWRTARSWSTKHLFKEHGYHFITIHEYLKYGYDHVTVALVDWDR